MTVSSSLSWITIVVSRDVDVLIPDLQTDEHFTPKNISEAGVRAI